MVAMTRLLYQHRRLLWLTTLTDIKARYTGTVLGKLWVPLYPLLFLGIYSFVYVYIFQIRLQVFSSNEYVVLIFCGLVPFLGFAEVLGSGVGSIVVNANLIKNTMYPIELIPVKSVLASQFTQVVGMCLLLLVALVMGRLSMYTLLLPFIWFLQVLFMIGVLWILASINVYVRDLQSVIGILLLLLMLVSPIAYTIDMVPENLRILCWINPLAHFIWAYQAVLMLGKGPDFSAWIALTIIGLGTYLAGGWFIARMKHVFVDNV